VIPAVQRCTQPVLELVDDRATVPQRIRLHVVDPVGASRPRRVEGIKGLLHGQLAQVSVAEVAVVRAERHEAAEQVLIAQADLVAGAVDVRRMQQHEVRTAAEDIGVLQLHAGGAGAAAAAVVESGIQCPDILGGDLQIHLAVVVSDGADPGVVEDAVGAQDALGLIDQASRVGLAGLEQQLMTDDAGTCAVVQPVGEAKQPGVVLGVFQIEDVLVVEQYLADHGMRGFQFRIRRDPGCLTRRPVGLRVTHGHCTGFAKNERAARALGGGAGTDLGQGCCRLGSIGRIRQPGERRQYQQHEGCRPGGSQTCRGGACPWRRGSGVQVSTRCRSVCDSIHPAHCARPGGRLHCCR
jgi:hypothetical protein